QLVSGPCRARVERTQLPSAGALHGSICFLDHRLLATQRGKHAATGLRLWTNRTELRPVLRDHRVFGARYHGAQCPWVFRSVSVLSLCGAELIRARVEAAR